jgi:hypothetical protein
MLVNAGHCNPADDWWPFALKLASEINGTIPKQSKKKTLELFTGIDIRQKMSHLFC